MIEALHHSGIFYGRHMDIRLVNGEELTEESVDEELKDADGILVPGGFGIRGVDGKMVAIRRAREQKIPYLLPRRPTRSLILCPIKKILPIRAEPCVSVHIPAR